MGTFSGVEWQNLQGLGMYRSAASLKPRSNEKDSCIVIARFFQLMKKKGKKKKLFFFNLCRMV